LLANIDFRNNNPFVHKMASRGASTRVAKNSTHWRSLKRRSFRSIATQYRYTSINSVRNLFIAKKKLKGNSEFIHQSTFLELREQTRSARQTADYCR
jgi:hypothetical protein